MELLCRVVLACALLCGACVSLRCGWMDEKFKQYSEEMMELLDKMVGNATNTSQHIELAFPHHVYQLASKAPAEEKLAFTVQVLKEVSELLEEDHKAASWDQKKVDDFLSVLHKQAEELGSCIKGKGHFKKHKKLQMYFKRLSQNILEQKNHSAAAWEITRQEIKLHLLHSDLIASALIPVR